MGTPEPNETERPDLSWWFQMLRDTWPRVLDSTDLDLAEAWYRSAGDHFLRIAVLGHFSAGKSSLINALLGCELLANEKVPSTGVIHRVTCLSQESVHRASDDRSDMALRRALAIRRVKHVTARDDRLSGVVFYDSPGYGESDEDSQMAAKAVRMADLVLWVWTAQQIGREEDTAFGEQFFASPACESSDGLGPEVPVLPVVSHIDTLRPTERERFDRCVRSKLGPYREAVVSELFGRKYLGVNASSPEDGSCDGVSQLRDGLRELATGRRLQAESARCARAGRALKTCAAQLAGLLHTHEAAWHEQLDSWREKNRARSDCARAARTELTKLKWQLVGSVEATYQAGLIELKGRWPAYIPGAGKAGEATTRTVEHFNECSGKIWRETDRLLNTLARRHGVIASWRSAVKYPDLPGITFKIKAPEWDFRDDFMSFLGGVFAGAGDHIAWNRGLWNSVEQAWTRAVARAVKHRAAEIEAEVEALDAALGDALGPRDTTSRSPSHDQVRWHRLRMQAVRGDPRFDPQRDEVEADLRSAHGKQLPPPRILRATAALALCHVLREQLNSAFD